MENSGPIVKSDFLINAFLVLLFFCKFYDFSLKFCEKKFDREILICLSQRDMVNKGHESKQYFYSKKKVNL